MSKKKGKFDLTHLVTSGVVKDGQNLYFVSNPKQSCTIAKQPNGEYKVTSAGETMTVHAFATKCLGMDPPDHATKWLRDEKGSTLYDFWHMDDDYSYAA
ncbi:MAG: hypothetical protein H7301_03345 [Cryobacterium sp.]|nr:hypothetical protein [Oligoflexia bacterium]